MVRDRDLLVSFGGLMWLRQFNQKFSYDGILLGGLQLYIQSCIGRSFSCVFLDVLSYSQTFLKLSQTSSAKLGEGIGINVYKFP